MMIMPLAVLLPSVSEITSKTISIYLHMKEYFAIEMGMPGINHTPNILQKYKTYTNIHININI